jgi:hypothetical protein
MDIVDVRLTVARELLVSTVKENNMSKDIAKPKAPAKPREIDYMEYENAKQFVRLQVLNVLATNYCGEPQWLDAVIEKCTWGKNHLATMKRRLGV